MNQRANIKDGCCYSRWQHESFNPLLFKEKAFNWYYWYEKDLIKIIDSLDGQCLHAQSLGFIHPKTEKNHIYQCDMPKNLRNLIDSFKKGAIEK